MIFLHLMGICISALQPGFPGVLLSAQPGWEGKVNIYNIQVLWLMLLHYLRLAGWEIGKSNNSSYWYFCHYRVKFYWAHINVTRTTSLCIKHWTCVLPANPHNSPQCCCQRTEAIQHNLVFKKRELWDRPPGFVSGSPSDYIWDLEQATEPLCASVSSSVKWG